MNQLHSLKDGKSNANASCEVLVARRLLGDFPLGTVIARPVAEGGYGVFRRAKGVFGTRWRRMLDGRTFGCPSEARAAWEFLSRKTIVIFTPGGVEELGNGSLVKGGPL